MSLPSLAELEHADWPTLKRFCATLGLNPKGRSAVVRLRVMDHVRRRVHPETWRAGPAQQAALLMRLGFPDTALRLWDSAIRLDAPAPWIGLGSAQLGSGDLSEAARSFERAAQMGDAAAHLDRAEALAAVGNYEGAVRSCDACLAARPGELRALLLKANFLSRGGWTGEAATVMRDAFESHPDVRELWRGLGTMLLKGARYTEASEAYHEALRSDPMDADAWINRGAALLLAGHTHESIGAFREALELDPGGSVGLNDLGVAYLREGQTKSAAVNLERAAKHMETPQILLNVAKVQEAAHRDAEALESYSRVLQMKPKDAEAAAAQKRLTPPPPKPVRKTVRRRPRKRPPVSRVPRKRKSIRSRKPRRRAISMRPRPRRRPAPKTRRKTKGRR